MRELLLCIDTQTYGGRYECVLEHIHNQNGRDKEHIHAHQIGYSFEWLKSAHIFLAAERYYILCHHCCWLSSLVHCTAARGRFSRNRISLTSQWAQPNWTELLHEFTREIWKTIFVFFDDHSSSFIYILTLSFFDWNIEKLIWKILNNWGIKTMTNLKSKNNHKCKIILNYHYSTMLICWLDGIKVVEIPLTEHSPQQCLLIRFVTASYQRCSFCSHFISHNFFSSFVRYHHLVHHLTATATTAAAILLLLLLLLILVICVHVANIMRMSSKILFHPFWSVLFLKAWFFEAHTNIQMHTYTIQSHTNNTDVLGMRTKWMYEGA